MEGLPSKLSEKKILVVGAGGIGCELLKNLVLTGFSNIDVVDLDTIDVSNLNRQFLFQKKHVGKSKAQVACESVVRFTPDAKLNYFHTSIMSEEFNVSRFGQYEVVFNALDNRAARIHVNRMCLAANVPLVESGSAGYLGQVSVIKKGKTECYECLPKSGEKSYPGCTIRNTPSEPIHCIVWAKHVFNQFFGEADIDEDVSPDMSDPELQQTNANGADQGSNSHGASGDTSIENGVAQNKGTIERISTRTWAEGVDFDSKKLFNKLFHDDIQYLLSMENLWKKRQPPTPLVFDCVPEEVQGSSKFRESSATIKDKRIQSPAKCRDVFINCVEKLSAQLKTTKNGRDQSLVWDKDDDVSMDFVTACANLRSCIFGIPLKSRFDIKSMAGNIIPAIATTNAIVAGLIVMEGLKILNGAEEKLKSSFLVRRPNPRGKIIVDMEPSLPNPKCYVCSGSAATKVKLNVTTLTQKMFEDKILKQALSMVAPDVTIVGKGCILISSDPDDRTDQRAHTTLAECGVVDGTMLECDDFMQEFKIRMEIVNTEELNLDEFEIVWNGEEAQPKPISREEPMQQASGDITVL